MSFRIESDKTAELHPFLVYPGSSGSGLVTPGADPVSIFLDPEFYRLDQENVIHPGLSYVNDALLPEHFGHSRVDEARKYALREAGSRTKPLFFEVLLKRVFEDEALDLKHMMVGVTPWTGDYYHDLGFLASKSSR